MAAVDFSDRYIFWRSQLDNRSVLLLGVGLFRLLDTPVLCFRHNDLQIQTTRRAGAVVPARHGPHNLERLAVLW